MINYSINDLNENDISNLNSIKPEEWTSITEIHAHYLKSNCCKCIKVIDIQQEIIGIGTGIIFNQTGWLAHIIVSKKFQKQGIGTYIVNDRINLLKNEYHCKTITLTATDQGYPVYKKIGFSDESKYVIMGKSQDYKPSIESNNNIIKADIKHYNEMLEIDRITSGEDREDLLKAILNNGFVYYKNGSVQGFYLPQFGDSGISANTEEAGIALLQERMKDDKKIFIPEENTIAYQYLIDNGYKELKRIYRMILGNPLKRNPLNCFSRIGGFAG